MLSQIKNIQSILFLNITGEGLSQTVTADGEFVPAQSPMAYITVLRPKEVPGYL